MTGTNFYYHEGHAIEAEGTDYVSLVAYEGVPTGHFSGGELWATSDAVVKAMMDEDAPRDGMFSDIVLAFDAEHGVLAETSDGDTYFYFRDPATGLMEMPGWTWASVRPEDMHRVQRLVRMDGGTVSPDPLPARIVVTDGDRLKYLRSRLEFWIANLKENAHTYEVDGLIDTARRLRLECTLLDDILGRIDGREDDYIAGLKREGSL